MLKNLFSGSAAPGPARCAVFMSGSGTNCAELLKYRCLHPEAGFQIAALVTDAPETSGTRELGKIWDIPVVELDIRRFYQEHGEESIALSSPHRRELREEWTKALRKLLVPFEIDFAVLAGFMPLCNITAALPCLNVHPGDLTVEVAGERILAGLHIRPVERAILEGHGVLRSSVILAQPYFGSGKTEMDSGPVLGISQPMELELEGFSVAELREIDGARQTPPFRDRLREIALANLERLKFAGDHRVLPPAVADFAAGRFALSETGVLHYCGADGNFRAVRTVEYGGVSPRPVER